MSVFRCKQFEIKQSDSAMKVGTDSVLLGSLLTANTPKTILDIGTGTGLLALMMAQRFEEAKIDAVEIEKKAFEEANFNFSQSKWTHRLEVVNKSFQEFGNAQKLYDLIVSNPPYYETENHFSIASDQRSKARHTGALSFNDLVHGVFQLLSDHGICWMILPVLEFNLITQKASHVGLYVRDQIQVHPMVDKECNRIVFSLSKKPTEVYPHNFFIYDEKGTYTKEYKEVTMPFLLWQKG